MEVIEISNMEVPLVKKMRGYIPTEEYSRYEQLKFLEQYRGEIGTIVRGTNLTKVILIGVDE